MSRPDVSEERRPQIIDAAIRVFARKGCRNATMPDVAGHISTIFTGIKTHLAAAASQGS